MVFDRMIMLNLQPKKMKMFFKKYLAFEEAHGEPQGVDRVRKRALEYSTRWLEGSGQGHQLP